MKTVFKRLQGPLLLQHWLKKTRTEERFRVYERMNFEVFLNARS